jgi:hypothetical protein
MHKERFYTGVVMVIALVIATLFTLYVVSEGRHEESIEELQNRASEIKERYSQHRAAKIPASNEEASTGNGNEDTESAFVELAKKMDSMISEKEWEEFIENIVKAENGEQTEADKKQMADFLDGNRELILELRRLAEAGGSIVPPAPLFIRFARLLVESMALAAERGDYEEMFHNFRAATQLAEIAGNEPAVMAQGIRNVMNSIISYGISQHVRIDNLPPDRIAELITFAAQSGNRERIADALLVEGAEGMGLFDAIRTGNTDYLSFFTGESGEDHFEWGASLFFRLYGTVGRPLLDMDASLYVDITNRASEAMRLPFYEAKPILDEIDARVFSGFFSRFHPVTSMAAPSCIHYAERQANHEAQMGLMQIGLAVEQYQMQHGECPETLEEIAPTLGGTLPLDPFTGQPFVYEPREDGFTLYSARGSVIDPVNRRMANGTDAQGNIIWRYAGHK